MPIACDHPDRLWVFPVVPNQPRLVISIDFLELYHALFEHTGDMVTAMSVALNKLYIRRGYPVNTNEVSLIVFNI
jgi:hypothetical protein